VLVYTCLLGLLILAVAFSACICKRSYWAAGILPSGRAARMLLVALLVVLGGVVSAVTAAAADAARPKKGARYKGKTSQNRTIRIKIDRRGNIDFAAATLRTGCVTLGRESLFGDQSLVRVGRGGRFSSVSFQSDLWLNPVKINGRGVVDMTRETLSGRFVTSRRATGTWRMQSLVFDRRTFPAADQRPVDQCDTGAVTWKARLRR
jgi:hypothetical protein